MREQLVIEYFKAIREEINLRIRNHTALVTAKIITAGSILAFMCKEGGTLNAKISALGLLLVPAVTMLYDVLISNNICNINRMGTFIRNAIEPFAGDIKLWEGNWAQKDVKDRCYGIPDVIALSLLTFGSSTIAILLLWYAIEHSLVYWLGGFVLLAWITTTWYMVKCFRLFYPKL